MSKRNIDLYLLDIISAIDNIIKYTKNLSLAKYRKDGKTIDAVIRNLEIIGEAANNLPKEITIVNSNIPWDKIIAMRNKVIHEYFGVDVDILWQTIKEDLPELRKQIRKLL
jgi:uncharacterized protein with HEPN domain